MKFLQISSLDAINALLSFETNTGHYVNGRVEVYSCKAAGVDKKLYRYLESKYLDDVFESKSLSPEQSSLTNIVSPFGPMTESAPRKTLYYLIATLNASFPDYDFRTLLADQFSRKNDIQALLNTINTTFFNVGCPDSLSDGHLWNEIDKAIELNDCVVYSYTPEAESDPYGEVCPVWSFNYFFYNKKLKRILFFTCYCSSEPLPFDEVSSTANEEVYSDIIDFQEPEKLGEASRDSWSRSEIFVEEMEI